MNIPLGIQLYIAPQPEVQPTPGTLPDSRSFSLTAAATELEVLSNSVEMKQAVMLLDDDCLLQVNSSNNALASCKSLVSNPSVNQL